MKKINKKNNNKKIIDLHANRLTKKSMAFGLVILYPSLSVHIYQTFTNQNVKYAFDLSIHQGACDV